MLSNGYCSPCSNARNSNRSSEQIANYNAINALAYKVANGKAEYDKMSRIEKKDARQLARDMIELGMDLSVAERNEKSDKRGFVYVIEHPAFPGYVKIGRAFHPESRLRSYQTGCPHRGYTLYGAVYFEDCYFAEKEIHARLDGEHRNGALGEWFNISPFLAKHNINKLRSVL